MSFPMGGRLPCRRWCLAALCLPGVLHASPVIDGRLDPSEGYAQGWLVDFAVDGVPGLVSGGQLWVDQDGAGDVSVAFIQPVTLNDNSYGVNSIGWGNKKHRFGHLLNSDAARIAFSDAQGNTVLDVTFDYLFKNKATGVYGSGLGGESVIHAGSAANVLAAHTSLDYNLNVVGHLLTIDSPAADANYVVSNPAYADWVFELVYEVKVSHLAFGAAGYGTVHPVGLHDSPAKQGTGAATPFVTKLVFPPTPPQPAVPEPSSLALLLVAAPLLRRRRQVA